MTTTPSDVADTSKPLLNVIARFRAPTATSKRTLVCSAAGVLSELYNRAVSESNPGVVVLTIPAPPEPGPASAAPRGTGEQNRPVIHSFSRSSTSGGGRLDSKPCTGYTWFTRPGSVCEGWKRCESKIFF